MSGDRFPLKPTGAGVQFWYKKQTHNPLGKEFLHCCWHVFRLLVVWFILSYGGYKKPKLFSTILGMDAILHDASNPGMMVSHSLISWREMDCATIHSIGCTGFSSCAGFLGLVPLSFDRRSQEGIPFAGLAQGDYRRSVCSARVLCSHEPRYPVAGGVDWFGFGFEPPVLVEGEWETTPKHLVLERVHNHRSTNPKSHQLEAG